MNRHHLDHILSALGPRLIVFDETLGLDDLLSTASAPSLALGHWVSPYWYLFTAFVGLNLFQSAFTNSCPMIPILRKLGVKSGGCL